MKKIISFSLYGDNPIYQQGAIENLQLAAELYPGWIYRFYVSHEIPSQIIHALECNGAEVVKKRRKHESDGKFWRFLPAGEKNLELLIIRDTDSRINEREKQAVEMWIESGKAFHIMRDHPYHTYPILAGMWGCKEDVLSDITYLIWRWQVLNWMIGHSGFDGWDADQKFLSHMIYPRTRGNVLIHTDLVHFHHEETVPFPYPRHGLEYVGKPFRNAEEERELATVLSGAQPKTFAIPNYGLAAKFKAYLANRLQNLANRRFVRSV